MPFDTDKFLTFDPPASIAVGTLSAIKSYDGVARNFALGTVIEHLCSGANPTTKFQLGFGDLAADIGTRAAEGQHAPLARELELVRAFLAETTA